MFGTTKPNASRYSNTRQMVPPVIHGNIL